jgi:hypothetical protein
LAIALGLLASPSANSQGLLAPAELKKVNALSGNTFAWAVLRKAVAMALAEAGKTDLAADSDSVDTIATVIALEVPDGRLAPVLSGAARGGLMATARPDLLANIGLDGGRATAVGCLVFGQSPAERTLLADLIGLDVAERAACAEHFGRIRAYWLDAAAAIRLNEGDAESNVEVLYTPASGVLASARSVIIAGETVDEVGYFLRRFVRFPRPVVIAGASCDAPRVEFDAAGGQLRFCYELFGEIAESISQSVGGQ